MSPEKQIKQAFKITKGDKPSRVVVVVSPEQRAAVLRNAMKNSPVKVRRKHAVSRATAPGK